MKQLVYAVLILFVLLSQTSAAFSNVTHTYICAKVASDVWGNKTASECLTFDIDRQTRLCTQISQIAGEDAYGQCLHETEVGEYLPPASIPDLLFNDAPEHYDYSTCNVKGAINRELICGDPLIRPAVNNSEKWFARASAVGDVCTRIALFCIGSNYYADSRFKLNNMRNLKMCSFDVPSEIDQRVAAGGIWEFNAFCTFDGWVQRTGQTVREQHAQTFTFSSSTIDAITGNLTVKAAYIASLPLSTTATVKTTTATTRATMATTRVSTTAAVTTTFYNETQALYEEAEREARDFVDQSFSIIDLLGMNNTGGYEARGKGNVFIKMFLILFVLFGFAVGAIVFIRMELKQRQMSKASTLEVADSKATTTTPKPMPPKIPQYAPAIPVKQSLPKPPVVRPSAPVLTRKPHAVMKPIPPVIKTMPPVTTAVKPPTPMAVKAMQPAPQRVPPVLAPKKQKPPRTSVAIPVSKARKARAPAKSTSKTPSKPK